MKKGKLIALIGILALAFMAAPALANSVLNGDFQYANPTNLFGWTQVTDVNHVPFSANSSGSNFFARAASAKESSMYQIVDASQIWDPVTHTLSANSNWNAGGSSESYDFTFQYMRKGNSTAEYGIYYATSASAPAFGGLDSANAGWTLLSGNESLGVNTALTSVEVSGILAGIQPRWFVVAFEGQKGSGSSNMDVDNVTLATASAPAPIPGSVLLLGSGLVGVGLLRFRRREKKA